jgi:hypothetical protein
MDSDKVRFGNEFAAPYVFDEVCPRQQLVAPLHHVLDQLEFARPQINRPIATLSSAIDEIELQWSHAQHRFSRFDRRSILEIISAIDNGSFDKPLFRRDARSTRLTIFSTAFDSSECSSASSM